MGRSPVREPHFNAFKGRISDRNRIERLESIEKKLKEIPKIEKQHKAALEKEKVRNSKKYKGFQLLYSPRVKPVRRAPESVITQRDAPELPPLDAALKHVADNKHLTSLPPHLQAELDELRAARKLADSIGGRRSAMSKQVAKEASTDKESKAE